MRRLTVQDLVNEVRSLIDEENTQAIETDRDVLPALNRAQDFISDVLARRYNPPLLTNVTYGASDFDTQQQLEIPEDAFEDRIEKIEIFVNGYYQEIEGISFQHGTNLETTLGNYVPTAYSIVGRKIKFYPRPLTTYPFRVWYQRDPGALVLPSGRINLVNTGSRYVVLNDIDDVLTTDQSELNSYVNIVDGETGVVKASLQIQSIANTKVTFKSIPTRTNVLGRTVVGTLEGKDIQPDDYICVVSGVCVPYLKKPLANFIIQYAAFELQKKLGGNMDVEKYILEKLESHVEKSWAGRTNQSRVRNTNPNLGGTRNRRRWVLPQGAT
jgi:hypothetical protein